MQELFGLFLFYHILFSPRKAPIKNKEKSNSLFENKSFKSFIIKIKYIISTCKVLRVEIVHTHI